MSLALELCRLAEEQVGGEALARVTALGLEVGNRSGVAVDNLAFCLAALLTSPPFRAARAVIERSEGAALRLQWLEIDDDAPGSDDTPIAEDDPCRWA